MPGPFQPQNVNFIAGINPELYQKQQALSQQQALAQQMMGEGLEPINPTRMAGRFVVPISPLEGAAHAGKAIAAAMMQRNINKQQSDLSAQQMQAVAQYLRDSQRPQQPQQPVQLAQNGVSDSSAGAVGAPWAAASTLPQPAPQPVPQAPQRDPMADYVKLGLISQTFGPQAAAVAQAGMMPTDLQKNLSVYGGDPSQQQAMGSAVLRKQGYIAPSIVRQNSVALGPDNNVLFSNPAAAPGTTNRWQPGNPYPTENVRIPGSLENIGAEAQATAFGKSAGEFPFRNVQTPHGEVPAFTVQGLVNSAPTSPIQAGTQTPPFRGAPSPQPPSAQAPAAPKEDQNDPWTSMPKVPASPQSVGISPYEGALQKARAGRVEGLSEKYGKLADENNQKIANNNQVLSLVDRADTGPMAVQIADVKNWLTSRFGIPEGDFANTPSATQSLNKDLLNAAIQKARQYYGGKITTTEVTLQISRGSPNTDMTKAAIKYLTNLDNAINQYGIQQGNDLGPFLARGGDPLQFEQWYAKAFPMSKATGAVHLDTGPQPTAQDIVDELRRRGKVR